MYLIILLKYLTLHVDNSKHKNGGHVISRSEKRVKHIVLVYNAHPSCKIKNLCKIQRIMHQ
jgi:hypothetical protein